MKEGIPRSLCRAESPIYVTTAGTRISSDEYGYGYEKILPKHSSGSITSVRYRAEGLDVVGADVEDLLQFAGVSVSGANSS